MTPKDVPNGPLLVDTDVFSWIAWQRDRHAEYAQLIQGHVLALSFATVGELWVGAEKAGWGALRRQELGAKLHLYVVLPSTDNVAQQWGRISAKFRGQLSQNDIWIAACALAQPEPLPIVTGNLNHFGPIAAALPIRLVHPDL